MINWRKNRKMLPILMSRPYYCCYWQHYLTCIILHCFDVICLSIKMVCLTGFTVFVRLSLVSAVIMKTFTFASLQLQRCFTCAQNCIRKICQVLLKVKYWETKQTHTFSVLRSNILTRREKSSDRFDWHLCLLLFDFKYCAFWV